MTLRRAHPLSCLCQTVGRPLFPCGERGKSGLHGGAVPGNARRGRPQGKCHRKYTAKLHRPGRESGKGEMVRQERTAPPATAAAGKTPPGARPSRSGRRQRGDPAAPGVPSRRRSGRSQQASGDGRRRGMAVAAAKRYRTRLIGRLASYPQHHAAGRAGAAGGPSPIGSFRSTSMRRRRGAGDKPGDGRGIARITGAEMQISGDNPVDSSGEPRAPRKAA